MPSVYAHYRFGAAMIPVLPGDIRRTVKRFRQLYDVGLHGPDIFFYYNPILKSKTGSLGSRFHRQSGRDFFTRVCRSLRLDPAEAGQAYLYGVLTHYCLDSVCHPYIKETAEATGLTHARIETEFDRFLLELDGKTPPHTQDLSPHIRLTAGECDTVAKFYPPASTGVVRDAVRNMAFFVRLLAAPEGARRTLLRKGIPLAGKSREDMLMTEQADPRCAAMNTELFSLYEKAECLFPELLEQVAAHLTYNATFGAEFTADFG